MAILSASRDTPDRFGGTDERRDLTDRVGIGDGRRESLRPRGLNSVTVSGGDDRLPFGSGHAITAAGSVHFSASCATWSTRAIASAGSR